MKVFLDMEFTGLHQNTSLISIALLAEDGKYFYAEFYDYDKSQIDSWLESNVISNLRFNEFESCITQIPKGITNNYSIEMKNNTREILIELKNWLDNYQNIEIWSDCLAYDWMLFCELFDGAMNLPINIYYIPFDICTLFKMKGIDPDVSREGFAGMAYGEGAEDEKDTKHNALWDAMVIKGCYDRLIK